MTYNPNLAEVKVDPHTKYQGHRSNGSAVRALTDRETDRRTDAVDKNVQKRNASLIFLLLYHSPILET